MLDLADNETDQMLLPVETPPAGSRASQKLGGQMTLVLNADYQPIKTMDWKQALNGIVRNILYPVEHYDIWLRSPSERIQLPSVAALREYVHVHRPAPLTRRNLMLIYGMRCALCGESFEPDDLTREHLQPQSRGGDSSWTNIVPACRPCNHGKANKTLSEANITLAIPIKKAPTSLAVLKARLDLDFAEPPHPTWLGFLKQDYWDKPIDD